MLKAEINKEEISLEVQGNIIDLTTDITMLLVGVHRNLPDEETKSNFRRMIKDIANEEVYAKTPEQITKSIEEKIKKDLMAFLKKFGEELV